MDEKKAERWLEKLEKGLTLREGWPKYHVGLSGSGALMVRFASTDPDSIEREAQRLRDMGLEEGVHFTVKMPEGGKAGYVYILKEGLAYAAWLSVRGSGEQGSWRQSFVEYILQKGGGGWRRRLRKSQKDHRGGQVSRGSQTLKDFEGGWLRWMARRYVVKVIGGGAEFDEGRSGKKLLRIRITAEVTAYGVNT
jgi:hypothetical protein